MSDFVDKHTYVLQPCRRLLEEGAGAGGGGGVALAIERVLVCSTEVSIRIWTDCNDGMSVFKKVASARGLSVVSKVKESCPKALTVSRKA